MRIGADKRLYIEGRSYLKHHTIGIQAVKHGRPLSEYKRWAVPPFRSLPLEYHDRQYYLYAVVERGGNVGTWKLTPEPIALEAVADVYHLLTALVGAEHSTGERSITPLYGFTEVLPGQINTARIVSNDGATYFDLERGEIGGNIRFRGGKDADTFIAEALQAHDESDYLHRAFRNGTTEIGGGVVASHVVALKDVQGVVRAYLDGRGASEVALGAGVSSFGTDEEARNVTIRHDGACAIGEMRVEAGTGRIRFEDGGGSYLSLGGAIDDLNDIVNTRMQSMNEATHYADQLTTMSGNAVLAHRFTARYSSSIVRVEGFKLRTRATLTGVAYSQAGGGATLRVVAEVTPRGGELTEMTVASYYLGRGVGRYDYGTRQEKRDLTFSGEVSIPRGVLGKVYFVVERPEYSSLEVGAVAITISGDNYGISKGAVALGGNGIAIFLGEAEVFSLIKGQGLRYVGAMDTPGYLASGSVDTQQIVGQYNNAPMLKVEAWGAKAKAVDGGVVRCTGLGASHYGFYKVFHSVGHTRYSVTVTPITDNAYADITATVYHKTADSFWVYIRHDGQPPTRHYPFDYAIFGLNS